MAFWKWWTGVVLIIVSAILLEIFTKSVTYIYINDSSYISLFIFCIFVVVTSIIGYRSFLLQFRNITPTENQMMFPWFAADAVTSMGMIGTIIGFLLVLGGAFADVDPTNVEAMKKVVENLTSGMGIALLTTLTGLITSVIMKFQLVLLENEFETPEV
tara:strand:+ start:68 stop:541 length:474 start_codon:yes stop_codon:yes gene_type:complete